MKSLPGLLRRQPHSIRPRPPSVQLHRPLVQPAMVRKREASFRWVLSLEPRRTPAGERRGQRAHDLRRHAGGREAVTARERHSKPLLLVPAGADNSLTL
jgi:hypothetical protein